MIGLAVLVGLASLIAGIALMAHTVPSCDTSGLDLCSGSTHPFTGVGFSVSVGGLIQATMIAVLGHVTRVVGRLRAEVQPVGKPAATGVFW